jgi:PKD repeat protein
MGLRMVRSSTGAIPALAIILLALLLGPLTPSVSGHAPSLLPSTPPNPYPIVGVVKTSMGGAASGASVWVNDTTKAGWVPLTTTTSGTGDYQVDLANEPPPDVYANGDTVTAQAVFSGETGTCTTTVNTGSPSGYGWCNVTLAASPLVVGLAVHPSTLFAGQSANLTSPVSGGVPPYQFNWTFGDVWGKTITHSPTNYTAHIYAGPGTFQANVTASSTLTGNMTASQHITVLPKPTLALATAPAAPQVGTNVRFTGTLSATLGQPWAYFISYGDGTNSGYIAAGGNVAYHAYASAGSFSANCTAWDGSTGYRVDSATVLVNVGPGIGVSLSSSPVSPTEVGVTTTFSATTANSNSAITAYSFAFGDGGTAGPQAAPSASHLYDVAGNLSASATATNTTGASGSGTLPVEVVPHVGVVFSSSVATGNAPLPVTFTAGAFRGVAPYTYDFWLGDRTNYTGNSSGTTTTTYLTPGNYTATVMATDSLGATAWQNLTLEVTKVPVTPLAITATCTPTSGAAPLAIACTSSPSGGTGTYTSFAWKFGDGGTSPLQDPSHTYDVAATYTPQVTVTDSSSATASTSVTVTVSAAVTLTIKLSGPHGGQAGQALAFVVNVTGGIPPYEGIFLWADGSGGTTVLPTSAASIHETHTFGAAGSYVLTVFINDSAGHSASPAQLLVVVQPAPSSPTLISQLSPGGALFPLLLLLLAVLVAVLIVALYVRRRKKKEEELDQARIAQDAAAANAAAASAAIAASAAPAPTESEPARPPDIDAEVAPPGEAQEYQEGGPVAVDWDELGNDGTPPPS